MTNLPKSGRGRDADERPPIPLRRLILVAVTAIIATFLVCVSNAAMDVKAVASVAIIAAFLLIALAAGGAEMRRSRRESADDPELDRALGALDVAAQYFAHSLTPVDALRLVTAQISMIVPATEAALYLAEGGRAIKTAVAVSTDDDANSGLISDPFPDVVNRCLFNGQVCYERAGRGRKAEQRIAVPLWRGGEVFGVLTVEVGGTSSGEAVSNLFESIGSRVTTLILSALSSERSRATAMTDAMTELPNERAFYLILENQIAETQRQAEVRPLSILVIDIRDFDTIGQKYGHAAGGRILNFAGHIIRENLRQMDFFARSQGGEFLAVLPTATREMSHEIVARIHAGFSDHDLEIADGHWVKVALNIGCASFGVDGEAAPQMLSNARARRAQPDLSDPAKILPFPNYASRL